MIFKCSVHVSDGFQKTFGWEWMGELYPALFWIFFNFAKPLTMLYAFLRYGFWFLN